MKPKQLATDFPMIPAATLKLIIEACRLPRKAQNLPERARKSRILAMRLRHVQAHQRYSESDVTAPGGTWQNVVEFLTAGLREGDFSVLDHFCDGWTQMRAEALAAEVVSFPGEGNSSKTAVISRPVNDPGVRMSIEIAGAILSLQDELGRPPYPQEVLDHCNHLKRGDAVANVSNADVSDFLKRWKLKGALPDSRKNPL